MKINLKFAELHTPLFLAGTNHGVKLNIDKRSLQLVYDRTEKELLVYFNKEVAIIPSSNVASMTPVDAALLAHAKPEPKKEVKTEINQTAKKPVKAQVSTPQSHVFAGDPGAEK